MSLWWLNECRDKCCVCHYDRNECGARGEDKFLTAPMETIINRLNNRRFKDNTPMMIRTLSKEYGYEYDPGYAEDCGWVLFDESKPTDGQHVFAITCDGDIERMYYDADYPNCLCSCGGCVKTFNIEYWAPIPKLFYEREV